MRVSGRWRLVRSTRRVSIAELGGAMGDLVFVDDLTPDRSGVHRAATG
jgi:hypothetical protein